MNKNLWLYGILAFIFIFIASSVIFRIFDIAILSSPFVGALIGVVITAIVTVFLLNEQTSAEETNVFLSVGPLERKREREREKSRSNDWSLC